MHEQKIDRPRPIHEGKIRSLYPTSIEDVVVMLVSDKVSAFDVVFSQSIPNKGPLLNQISYLWLKAIEKSELVRKYNFSTHLLTSDWEKFPEPYCLNQDFFERAMLIKKTKRINFECIVRGYLAGSAWKEYQKNQTVCGIPLEANLRAGEKLTDPIFTPSTKANVGEHDRNIDFSIMEKELGKHLAQQIRDISLAIYDFSAKKMTQCGILVADTKFEFGLHENKIVLIDEVLTPDSSRYWQSSDYCPGKIPSGFDKQYIRDYVEKVFWNKKAPAPELPANVINKTQNLYKEILAKVKKVL